MIEPVTEIARSINCEVRVKSGNLTIICRNMHKMQVALKDMPDFVYISDNMKYVWVRLKEKHMEAVLDIVKLSLYPNESVCKVVDLSNNLHMSNVVEDFMKQVAEQGVSLVAIEIATEQVVGFALNLIQVC